MDTSKNCVWKKQCVLNEQLFEACANRNMVAVNKLINSNKDMKWNYVAAFTKALDSARADNFIFIKFIVETFPELKSRIENGDYAQKYPDCVMFKEIEEDEKMYFDAC
jgi:hypothetical protein